MLLVRQIITLPLLLISFPQVPSRLLSLSVLAELLMNDLKSLIINSVLVTQSSPILFLTLEMKRGHRVISRAFSVDVLISSRLTHPKTTSFAELYGMKHCQSNFPSLNL